MTTESNIVRLVPGDTWLEYANNWDGTCTVYWCSNHPDINIAYRKLGVRKGEPGETSRGFGSDEEEFRHWWRIATG